MVKKVDMFGGAQTPGKLESTDEAWLPKGISTGSTAIEFRRKARSWFSFPYSYLTAVEYAPNGTEATVEPHIAVQFSGHRVIVRGHNLASLYEQIRQCALPRLAEMDRSEIMAQGEAAAVVESIEIEEI